MEAQRERSQGGWVPETPGKPNGPGPGPDPGRIYGDGQGQGGLLSYQTRYNTPQNNNEVQNFLPSYSINSIDKNGYQNSGNNNVNYVGGYGNNPSLGGNIELQSGNVEMERRVMGGYLPHWSSEGRRSVMSYGSNDLASVSYPVFSPWELNQQQWSNSINNGSINNGVRPNGSILENNLNESVLNTMSFGDLLSINESMTLQNNGGSTSNGMFLPNWVSSGETSGVNNGQVFNNQVFNNEEAFRGTNLQNNGVYSQGMQNDTIPGPVWRTIEPNSLPSTNHANRSTAVAPPTPDSWQRIQNNVDSENTPLGINQGCNEQGALQEQEADRQDKNVAGPVTESSTGKAPVLVEESHDLEKGENQGIDLNDTPQKKPRKRRYQPKVIRENKPKRTPIPKTPKPPETQGKRKYNRKPKTNTPTEPVKPTEQAEPTDPAKPTEPADPTEPTGPAEPTDPAKQTEPAEPTELKSTETTAKTCKKSLNFDLNGGGLDEEGQASECQETDNQCDQNVDLSQAAYDLNLSQKEELREYMSLPVKDNIDGSQTDFNTSLGENVISADRLSGRKDESSNSSPCASSSEGVQNRGAKRSLSYTAEPTLTDVETATVIESTTSWKPNQNAPKTTNTEILSGSSVPGICKRKRTENVECFVAGTEGIGIARSEVTLSKYYCNSTSQGISGVGNNHALNVERYENRDQLTKTWADISRLKKKRGTSGGTRFRDLASLTGIALAAKGESSNKVESVKGIYPSNEDTTKSTPKSTGRPEIQDSVNKNWTIVPYNRNLNARGRTGSAQARPRRRRGSTVAHITQLLQKLDINTEKIKRRRYSRSIVPYQRNKQDQNALVLYQRDSSMVPFEGAFNPAGKRRQRARVDLDDETTRVWRLLLENIDNEGVNGTDEDKAKWWENERRVFRGRVDSFIARMRLVQGDRRFTPWKGSVLDSVIGVFLTQNVSDHLSSSAFMSMAARFPLKPESPGSTLSEESTSGLFVEPEISVIEPEESITWNEKKVGQQTVDKNCRAIFYFDHSEEKEVVNSSETCQRASTYSRGFNVNSQIAEAETVYLLGEEKARDDATSSQQSVISSQNSIDSPNQQTVGIMNTFSESNSTTPAVTSGSQFNCLDHTASFMGLLKMAEGNINHQSYSQTQAQNHLEGMKFATEYYQEAPGVSSSNYQLNQEAGFHLRDAQGIDTLEVESRSSDMSRKDENSPPTEQSNLTSEITDQEKSPDSYARTALNMSSCYVLDGETMVVHAQMQTDKEHPVASSVRAETSPACKGTHVSHLSKGMADVMGSTREELERTLNSGKEVKQNLEHNLASSVVSNINNTNPSKTGTGVSGKAKMKTDANWDRLRRDAQVHKKTKKNQFDWDSLRRDAQVNGKKPERPANTRDSLDWDAVLHAKASDIAETIKERGMNNVLAGRIKDLLDRLVKDHGSIDMEWLREIPPDKAKEYLLSFRGLGLKSVECVRLLTLHHMAFPVDTNVGRIAVRLGWVPLQPLPESLQLHLLEMYPILESIQQYLWPRLCKLDQKTLYELHYHMITFGKVFCTKRQPNCNACPLRGECRHFASAFASARYALPGPEDKSIVPANGNTTPHVNPRAAANLLPSTASWGDRNPHPNSESYATAIVQGPSFPLSLPMPQTVHLEQSFPLSLSVPQTVHLERRSINNQCEPIVEVPASPEQETPHEQALCDIEDSFYEDPEEIPTINLNMKEFAETLQNFMLQEAGMSNALVALTASAASIPTPKLKNINRLRTEHHVYELPDTHPLIQGMEKREADDPCSYLLAIWTPGETADSIDPPARRCHFDDPNMLCNEETCFYCSSQREASSQTVRGTLLIPTRTAMRGSFPLNGTYFQVNEVFADHASSISPIAVPRSWLWNLPRRTVYFGTSIPTIFKGLSTEDIQHCFWRGYVCVRGFDQKTRAPRPLIARLHFPASRVRGKQYEE